nr:zinc ribbon domain-containing protein [Haloplanus sp. GDY1]
MAPGDGDPDDADESERPAHVYCPECGTKASADWAFCRNCEASLDDAAPADALTASGDGEVVDLSGAVEGETGCPKCGHTDADVDDIATTGVGLSRLFDVQNRRYRAVSCTRCGYTEFYKGRSPSEVVDLFIG